MALFRGFGFVRGWLCRFSKLACLFLAKVLINSVCKIVSASLALSVFCQSQFLQNFRSGSFSVLIGEVLFFSKRFG